MSLRPLIAVVDNGEAPIVSRSDTVARLCSNVVMASMTVEVVLGCRGGLGWQTQFICVQSPSGKLDAVVNRYAGVEMDRVALNPVGNPSSDLEVGCNPVGRTCSPVSGDHGTDGSIKRLPQGPTMPPAIVQDEYERNGRRGACEYIRRMTRRSTTKIIRKLVGVGWMV